MIQTSNNKHDFKPSAIRINIWLCLDTAALGPGFFGGWDKHWPISRIRWFSVVFHLSKYYRLSMESPSLEIVRTHLDEFLCHVLQVTLPWQEDWTPDFQRSLPALSIPWFCEALVLLYLFALGITVSYIPSFLLWFLMSCLPIFLFLKCFKSFLFQYVA